MPSPKLTIRVTGPQLKLLKSSVFRSKGSAIIRVLLDQYFMGAFAKGKTVVQDIEYLIAEDVKKADIRGHKS